MSSVLVIGAHLLVLGDIEHLLVPGDIKMIQEKKTLQKCVMYTMFLDYFELLC